MNRLRSWVRCFVEIGIQLARITTIEWSIRRRGLPATCRRLGIVLSLDGVAAAGSTAPVPRRYESAARATAVVTTIWPFGDTCLRRCLLFGTRIRDIGPVLRIGVQRDGGGVLVHSWLEIDGLPLDPTAADFGALDEVGRSPDAES